MAVQNRAAVRPPNKATARPRYGRRRLGDDGHHHGQGDQRRGRQLARRAEWPA
ncbi:hypothetical protein ACRAWF_22645 [Streptomyces sp. L7]